MGKIGRKLSKILSREPEKIPMYDFKNNKTVPGEDSSDEPIVSRETIQTMPIASLTPNTLQPRHVFKDDKLEELTASIKEKGLIQPVVFRKTDKGNELIAGERRWRAATQAGLTDIPAIEMQVSDEEALELAIIENIQRDDLNPIEKGRAFKMLIEKYSLTQQDVADRLGVNRTTVANLMRLLQLPSEVKDLVSRETLSMGHARCLLAAGSPENQVRLAKKIAKDGLSVRQAEELIYGNKTDKPVQTRTKTVKPANIVALEKKLTEALGSKVTIQNKKKNKGKIIVEYFSNDDFLRIADRLGIKL